MTPPTGRRLLALLGVCLLLVLASIGATAVTPAETPEPTITAGSSPIQTVTSQSSGAELAVVDTTVEDHDSLARAAREAGIEVVNVSSAAELTTALEGRSNLAAVHILSHGSVGAVQIGSDSLTVDTLADYRELTTALDESLAPGGDLLLYGCRVASDGSGQSFLGAVGNAIGGDITASEDLTGAADQGGDWDLEAQTGPVDTESIDASGLFSGILVTTYDWESGVTADTTAASPGASKTASQALSGTTFTYEVTTGIHGLFVDDETFIAGDAVGLNGKVVSVDSGAGKISEITVTASGGKEFDLNSIAVAETFGESEQFKLTTNTGATATSITLTNGGDTIDVSGDTNFDGISSFTITSTSGDGKYIGMFDNMEVENVQSPNTAPTLDLDGDATAGNGVTTSFTEATDQGTGSGNGVPVAPNAVFEDSEGTVDQLTLTLDNNQGDTGEQLFLAAGDLQGSVTGAGSGNTLTVVRNGATETELRDTLRNVRFQNGDDDPTTGTDRTITVNATDNAALTATDADTATITVAGSNDAPSLSTTGDDPTFIEDETAASLYSGTSAGVVESSQTVAGFEFTVTNVADGADEEISLDGSAISLTDSTSGTTTDNSMSYSVSVSGTTATVTLTGFSETPTSFESIIDAMAYRNTGDDPDTSSRTVTLTEITDSGGTANDGDADTTVSIGSTVSLTAVNDAPSITIGGDQSVGSTTDVQTVVDFATGFDPVESGQSISGFVVTNDDNSLFTAQPDIDNTGDLSYTPAADVSATATVSVQVVDDGGTANGGEDTSGTETFDISVDNVAPGFDSSATASIAEESTGAVLDVQAGDDGTTSPDTNVNYMLGGVDAGPFSIDTSTGELSLDSALDFEDPTDDNTDNDYELTVTASDGDNTAEQSITVSITDVNEAPTLDTNTGLTVLEGSTGTTITNTNLTASDPEQPAGEITYDVTTGVSSGTLSVDGSPVGTGTFTQADINAGDLTYSHDGSETTSDSVTFGLKDGVGGTLAGQTFSITVTSVNDAPTLSVTTGDATFTEDGSAATVFSGASADTVEVGQQISTLTVQVSNVTDGGDEVLVVDGSDVALTDGNSFTTAGNGLSVSVGLSGDTATVTLSGGVTAATANTIIDGLGYKNGDDPTTIDPRTITLTEITDDGGTANGGSDTTSLSESADVSISAVNDAPALSTDARSLNAVTEDDTDNAGTAVSTLLASAGTATDAEGDTLGVALTAVDDTDGTWEFSTDSGTTWETVSGTSPTASNALLLATTDRVRFVPNADFSGTAGGSVTVRAWDGTAGTSGTSVDTTTNGGTTAYSTNTASVGVSVTPVNDAPTDSSLSSMTVDQSGGTNAVVGSLSATDVDNTSHTFSLVSGTGDANNSQFNIDSGDLRANDAAVLAEGAYSVRIKADDGSGGSYNESFTISVVDDVAPLLTSSDPADGSTGHVPGENLTLSFDEPLSFGSGEITLRKNDSGFSDAETFAVTVDTGSGDGTVSITGSQLTINPTSDLVADTEYAVRIAATAINDTATTPNAFAGINNDDDLDFTTADTKPSFAQAAGGTISLSVDEDGQLDLTNALEVNDISASDTLTWSLPNGPPNASNGTVSNVDNESVSYTSGASHTLTSGPVYVPNADFAGAGATDDAFDVQINDSDGYTATATIEVDVRQVNDAPAVTLGSDRTVNGTTSQQTAASFATFAPGGGSDEAGQSVDDYTVTVASDPEGVISAVDIDDDGNLTYTANDSIEGTATVEVAVADDGGTANGGENTSTTEQFEVTVDTRSPTVDSASTTARTLTITMDEPLSEAAANTPPGANFTVTAGGDRINVSDVSISGSTISLGLDSRISFGEAVTLNYTRGTNITEDLATNQLANVSDQPVTNTVSRPNRGRRGGGGGGGGDADDSGSTVTVEPEPESDAEADDGSETDETSSETDETSSEVDTDSKSVSVRGATGGERVRIDLSGTPPESSSADESTGDAGTSDGTESGESGPGDSSGGTDAAVERPRNVVADGLDIQFAESGDYDLTVRTRDADTSDNAESATGNAASDAGGDSGSASRPDLSTNSLDDEGKRFARETRQRPVGFIEVDTAFEADAVEEATHRFRVRKSYLETTGASVESVRLYRDEISQWRTLDTRQVGANEEFYFFEADTPGFSMFVIGTSAPVFETATPTLNSFNETTGEINATVSVENIGNESGIYESTLTAGGTSIATVEREIGASETVDIPVSGTIESTGTVAVRFAGASLGDVTRSEAVDEESARASVWPLVLAGILVSLVALAVVWRRRTTDDNS